MTRSTRVLCLMHLVGNAILLWVAYEWLNIGESSMLRLGESLVLGIAIMIAALWLHGSAMAHFASGDRSRLRPALGSAVKHILPLFLLGLFVVVVYVVLEWWDSSIDAKSGAIRKISDVAIWLFRWLIFPVLLLPLGTSVATKGFRGYTGDAWRRSKNLFYWIEVVVLLLCAIWVPLKLIGWVPKLNGFGLQMTSFTIRLVVGYLLFVAAWLLLELASSGGRPRTSQPMTASAP